MNDAVHKMLDRYNCHSVDDYENAIKEIIQEIALLGLWRSKFFEKAAFYGGSALRILYGLDRFSEDLDFSLLSKNQHFSIADYCVAVEEELKSFGFAVIVEKKSKIIRSQIDSAFIKAGIMQNMITVNTPNTLISKIHSKKIMKIKLEVDINPPEGFNVEAKYLFLPIPFSVRTYTQPDIFAGKMHALLCRSWQNRVKGRDWYDLVWYIGRKTPVHLKHLECRMKQSKHLKRGILTKKLLRQMLEEKINTINFEQAKKDVEKLLKDSSPLMLWSKEYFKTICQEIQVV